MNTGHALCFLGASGGLSAGHEAMESRNKEVQVPGVLEHGQQRSRSPFALFDTSCWLFPRLDVFSEGKGYVAAPAYLGTLAEVKEVPVTPPLFWRRRVYAHRFICVMNGMSRCSKASSVAV
eukprot:561442-Pelagomonas_calceolata.AAC.1